MEELLRDVLAEEEGYVICPLFQPYQYIHCDENCEKCEYYIEFEKWCKENLKEV